jgi:hypothetical protein
VGTQIVHHQMDGVGLRIAGYVGKTDGVASSWGA